MKSAMNMLLQGLGHSCAGCSLTGWPSRVQWVLPVGRWWKEKKQSLDLEPRGRRAGREVANPYEAPCIGALLCSLSPCHGSGREDLHMVLGQSILYTALGADPCSLPANCFKDRVICY